eukprot:Cvel_15862.t1-p1 / transcript=Cvel_15862.t1 / gene=Cvel_15862 / organism=Chromera_velia_CCMP2878 / gene_product=hypothetical protein / transcript_product=hypothetical protein / location=Cvel_scaffold1196:1-12749(-) / protein_length=2028 / sequence_SO=supercontig / SO=protein_coding / is_pseudo=false
MTTSDTSRLPPHLVCFQTVRGPSEVEDVLCGRFLGQSDALVLIHSTAVSLFDASSLNQVASFELGCRLSASRVWRNLPESFESYGGSADGLLLMTDEGSVSLFGFSLSGGRRKLGLVCDFGKPPHPEVPKLPWGWRLNLRGEEEEGDGNGGGLWSAFRPSAGDLGGGVGGGEDLAVAVLDSDVNAPFGWFLASFRPHSLALGFGCEESGGHWRLWLDCPGRVREMVWVGKGEEGRHGAAVLSSSRGHDSVVWLFSIHLDKERERAARRGSFGRRTPALPVLRPFACVCVRTGLALGLLAVPSLDAFVLMQTGSAKLFQVDFQQNRVKEEGWALTSDPSPNLPPPAVCTLCHAGDIPQTHRGSSDGLFLPERGMVPGCSREFAGRDLDSRGTTRVMKEASDLLGLIDSHLEVCEEDVGQGGFTVALGWGSVSASRVSGCGRNRGSSRNRSLRFGVGVWVVEGGREDEALGERGEDAVFLGVNGAGSLFGLRVGADGFFSAAQFGAWAGDSAGKPGKRGLRDPVLSSVGMSAVVCAGTAGDEGKMGSQKGSSWTDWRVFRVTEGGELQVIQADLPPRTAPVWFRKGTSPPSVPLPLFLRVCAVSGSDFEWPAGGALSHVATPHVDVRESAWASSGSCVVVRECGRSGFEWEDCGSTVVTLRAGARTEDIEAEVELGAEATGLFCVDLRCYERVTSSPTKLKLLVTSFVAETRFLLMGPGLSDESSEEGDTEMEDGEAREGRENGKAKRKLAALPELQLPRSSREHRVKFLLGAVQEIDGHMLGLLDSSPSVLVSGCRLPSASRPSEGNEGAGEDISMWPDEDGSAALIRLIQVTEDSVRLCRLSSSPSRFGDSGIPSVSSGDSFSPSSPTGSSGGGGKITCAMVETDAQGGGGGNLVSLALSSRRLTVLAVDGGADRVWAPEGSSEFGLREVVCLGLPAEASCLSLMRGGLGGGGEGEKGEGRRRTVWVLVGLHDSTVRCVRLSGTVGEPLVGVLEDIPHLCFCLGASISQSSVSGMGGEGGASGGLQQQGPAAVCTPSALRICGDFLLVGQRDGSVSGWNVGKRLSGQAGRGEEGSWEEAMMAASERPPTFCVPVGSLSVSFFSLPGSPSVSVDMREASSASFLYKEAQAEEEETDGVDRVGVLCGRASILSVSSAVSVSREEGDGPGQPSAAAAAAAVTVEMEDSESSGMVLREDERRGSEGNGLQRPLPVFPPEIKIARLACTEFSRPTRAVQAGLYLEGFSEEPSTEAGVSVRGCLAFSEEERVTFFLMPNDETSLLSDSRTVHWSRLPMKASCVAWQEETAGGDLPSLPGCPPPGPRVMAVGGVSTWMDPRFLFAGDVAEVSQGRGFPAGLPLLALSKIEDPNDDPTRAVRPSFVGLPLYDKRGGPSLEEPQCLALMHLCSDAPPPPDTPTGKEAETLKSEEKETGKIPKKSRPPSGTPATSAEGERGRRTSNDEDPAALLQDLKNLRHAKQEEKSAAPPAASATFVAMGSSLMCRCCTGKSSMNLPVAVPCRYSEPPPQEEEPMPPVEAEEAGEPEVENRVLLTADAEKGRVSLFLVGEGKRGVEQTLSGSLQQGLHRCHSVVVSHPVTALAASPCQTILVAGLSSGVLVTFRVRAWGVEGGPRSPKEARLEPRGALCLRGGIRGLSFLSGGEGGGGWALLVSLDSCAAEVASVEGDGRLLSFFEAPLPAHSSVSAFTELAGVDGSGRGHCSEVRGLLAVMGEQGGLCVYAQKDGPVPESLHGRKGRVFRRVRKVRNLGWSDSSQERGRNGVRVRGDGMVLKWPHKKCVGKFELTLPHALAPRFTVASSQDLLEVRDAEERRGGSPSPSPSQMSDVNPDAPLPSGGVEGDGGEGGRLSVFVSRDGAMGALWSCGMGGGGKETGANVAALLGAAGVQSAGELVDLLACAQEVATLQLPALLSGNRRLGGDEEEGGDAVMDGGRGDEGMSAGGASSSSTDPAPAAAAADGSGSPVEKVGLIREKELRALREELAPFGFESLASFGGGRGKLLRRQGSVEDSREGGG